MKFIEITDTVCVNTDQICWVKKADDGFSCIIYVGDKEYPSDIPYHTIVSIITQEPVNPTTEKLDKFLSVATVQTI